MTSKSTLAKRIIILLLLIISLTFLLPPFPSPSIPILSSTKTKSLESFIQCFHNLTNLSNLISTSNTSSYQSNLLSSIKNRRFISSTTTAKPSLIITAKTEPHVQAAVICARRSNLNVRPRSGGHDYEGMSYSAHGTSTPFITIDISGLHSISFEGISAAWVQAGATLGELYYKISEKNKTAAFPAGFCPTVGVGGHVSGGGIGSLTRKFGTAADNVVDARLVDVNGRILDRKSMGEELFWAIRGAGAAGFGVIVAFKISLVEVPEKVTVFNAVRTSVNQNITQLVWQWQQLAHQLDVNLFIRLIAEAKTEEDETTSMKVTFSSLYLGESNELLILTNQSFPELELKASDFVEMSWLESFLFFNGEYGKLPTEALLNRNVDSNTSFKAKSDFVQELIPESGLEKIWRYLTEAYKDGEWFVLIMEPFGGKMSEISEDEIAFPHRKGNLYNIQYFSKWMDSEGKEKEGVVETHLKRMKSLYKLMTPYVSSKPRAAYYNYKDIDLGRNMEGRRSSYLDAEAWGTKYFKGNFRRLADLKSMVDPENFFWNEQSVPPLKGVVM